MGRKKSKAKKHMSGSAGISTNGLSFSSSSSSSSSSKSKLSSIKNDSGVNQIHKLLLCFRHGESLAQITPNKKIRQSDPSLRDAKLSKTGKRQAQALSHGEFLKTAPIKLAVCSPLSRSLQTCCLAFKNRQDVSIICHPDITEFGRRSQNGQVRIFL